jgi:anti-anti-sigma regulatory factor
MTHLPAPNEDAPTTLRIEGELTIFRAAELLPALMSSPPPAEIDLWGVTEIDSAGLQLLMLAKMRATAGQRTLRLNRPSPSVAEVFELLNLTAYFGDPVLLAPADPVPPSSAGH